MGQQEIGDRCRHAMTHAHVPISHQTSIIKQKFKDKFVQNFKIVTKEHQTNAGAFLQAKVILPGALDLYFICRCFSSLSYKGHDIGKILPKDVAKYFIAHFYRFFKFASTVILKMFMPTVNFQKLSKLKGDQKQLIKR